MLPCECLLNAGVIITQDKERRVLYDSALAIGDGKILDIGPAADLASRWSPKALLDLSGMLVMPGLVNAHAHAAMTFLRGVADDMPLMKWLNESIFPVEARLTTEICRLGSLLGYAEMLAAGITTCVDMYIFEEAVFEAAETAGLRCMGGEAVFAFPSAACANYSIALEMTEKLAEKYAGHKRIKVAVNPHSVYTTTPEILKGCRDLALRKNLPLHIHLAETANETSICRERHGMRPVEYCRSLGLFDAPVIAAHMVDLEEDEIRFLGQTRVSAAHCPSSNMKLASGVAPVPEMLGAGINVALGTDGPASNNQLNIFMEMRQAALLHKLAKRDPAVLPASTALDMATLGGANAFGDSRLGRLEKGAPADCIALDLASPNLLPLAQPVSHAVYAATGHECRLAMVEGEILYRDGKFSRFDTGELREEARELAGFAAKKA